MLGAMARNHLEPLYLPLGTTARPEPTRWVDYGGSTFPSTVPLGGRSACCGSAPLRRRPVSSPPGRGKVLEGHGAGQGLKLGILGCPPWGKAWLRVPTCFCVFFQQSKAQSTMMVRLQAFPKHGNHLLPPVTANGIPHRTDCGTEMPLNP